MSNRNPVAVLSNMPFRRRLKVPPDACRVFAGTIFLMSGNAWSHWTPVIYRPGMAANSPAIELASKATPNDKTAKTSKVISIITGDVAGPTRFQQLSEGSITTPVDRDIRGKFLLLDLMSLD